MSGDHTVNDRRFYRSADKRVLGGVCGGLSDYFGFNLKATRFLAVIGLFTPASFFVVASYLLAVVLIPSAPPVTKPDPAVDREFKRTMRASPGQAMNDARRRFQALDRRLARLEKYVTSSRYSLDREFRDLER
jgi:phage shock protein C